MSLRNFQFPECFDKQRVKEKRTRHKKFVKQLKGKFNSGNYSWGEISKLEREYNHDLRRIDRDLGF